MLKKLYHKYNLQEFRRNPFLWIYSAYLTVKYIDEFEIFPAIKFNSFVKIKFVKDKSSKISIKKRLIFEPFIHGQGLTIFTIGRNAKINIENDFVLGDGIRILVSDDAQLIIKGKVKETGSGITADSVIMVNKYLEIGEDCLMAWNIFLTDSDWHTVGNKLAQTNTIIGNHVWLGVGCKILKGVVLDKNTIVTSNTVVLKGTYPEQVLISGNPGKILKTGIPDWKR